MTNSPYLYQLVPPKVEGEFLLPLSQLREFYPELHQQHLAKYAGRESLISRPIPHINCSWLDSLQLTPVHPEEIKAALLEVGFGWRPMLFFEIDPARAAMDGSNTVIFTNPVKQEGDFAPRPGDFIPYSEQELQRYSVLPEATRAHFKEAKESSGRPMLFLWVPHVLFAGRIAVEKLKIIEI